MHTKRTTFLTKVKTGIHLEELKLGIETVTFLSLECSPIRKTNMFKIADLYRTLFDAPLCYPTRYTPIWRTGEHSNH